MRIFSEKYIFCHLNQKRLRHSEQLKYPFDTNSLVFDPSWFGSFSAEWFGTKIGANWIINNTTKSKRTILKITTSKSIEVFTMIHNFNTYDVRCFSEFRVNKALVFNFFLAISPQPSFSWIVQIFLNRRRYRSSKRELIGH